jgi:hypothetical protein
MIEYIITIFFTALLLFTLIKYFTKSNIIEGATGSYQEYSDDPLILAKKNAANIDILKKKVDEMSAIAKQTEMNTVNIDKNTQSINSLLVSMSPSSEEDSQKNQELVNDDSTTF